MLSFIEFVWGDYDWGRQCPHQTKLYSRFELIKFETSWIYLNVPRRVAILFRVVPTQFSTRGHGGILFPSFYFGAFRRLFRTAVNVN